MKKLPLILPLLLLLGFSGIAQEEYWFYIRAKDTTFTPQFTSTPNGLVYQGSEKSLQKTLSNYKIKTFKKTWKNARPEFLKRTFFVVADSPNFLKDILKKNRKIFESGEMIPPEDMKIYEPNDYGLTSTIGANTGLQFNMDYYDVMEVPKAWYLTTGHKDVIIGISDGKIDTLGLDFKDKATVLRKSSLANGHGYSISANAAAQGDNGYGIPGVCYDCSIYGTNYGDFGNFGMLKELAEKGAKVINCSWVGPPTDTGQEAINYVFDSGAIIVAGAGNKGWDVFPNGEKKYYPASYNNVISVSSVQHRYENIQDNIYYFEKTGKPFFKEIRGYLGRTGTFKNGTTNGEPKIYPVSTATLNEDVDILAPTVGLFRYSQFILKGEELGSEFSTTSGATALVSGTVGLMFSLYPCLPKEQVDGIIKLTATNIDHIEANKIYAGNYGAGMLNTGKTVNLVHDLFSETSTALISNQDMSRWYFPLTAFSEKVVIENQTFRDAAYLDLKAKNQIILKPRTTLRPNTNGSIILKIDPNLEKECNLRVRE
ncbi:thermophilic serine proteinase [unidentified eubacterium SCB49]|nr:thermophilic serine proteinase [unidentified eubacterium SCB49]